MSDVTVSTGRQYVWILPLILAIFVLLDGIAFLLFGGGAERDTILRVTGSSWEQIESTLPRVANYINNLAYIVGLSLVGFAIMIIAASITGYRRGERWAWLLSWYLPVYFLVAGILTYREGEHISLDALSADLLFAFFAISVIAQLTSYFWFFYKGGRKADQNQT